jgi:uncharacterized peroxidase-related enzyme
MINPEYELLAKLSRPVVSATQTNIPVVEESGTIGETADAYQAFRDTFGCSDVPGILKCFSSSPELLRKVMDLSSILLFSEGCLGRQRKEMIATYVSALNSCPYCLDSHGFFLRIHGAPNEVVSTLLAGDLHCDALDVSERALLEFVRKVNAEAFKITPEDVLHLSIFGWSNDQIAEAVHIASSFAFFNRVASSFGLTSQGLLGLDTDATS